VYFRFAIHRNPIIIVNVFNSSVSRAVSNDALLIIGMTNAINGRALMPRRDLTSRSISDVAVSANAVDPPFAQRETVSLFAWLEQVAVISACTFIIVI